MRAADGQTAEAPAVRVLLFAGLREALGWSERRVELAGAVSQAGQATPLGLWQQLDLSRGWPPGEGSACGTSTAAVEPAAQAPPDGTAPETPAALPDAMAQPLALPPGIRVAINQRFAEAGTPLVDGDELAFLPPISGG